MPPIQGVGSIRPKVWLEIRIPIRSKFLSVLAEALAPHAANDLEEHLGTILQQSVGGRQEVVVFDDPVEAVFPDQEIHDQHDQGDGKGDPPELTRHHGAAEEADGDYTRPRIICCEEK